MCPDPGLYLSCKHACFFKRVNRHSCIHKNVSRKIALWQQVFERSEVEEVQEGEETKKIVSQSQGERRLAIKQADMETWLQGLGMKERGKSH